MDRRVLVLGASGMVGSALVRALQCRGQVQILAPSHAQLDLLDARATDAYLKEHTPDCVILAAARVGGIWANQTYPAEFFYINATLALHVIHSSYVHGIPRLLFLGSTCIYPRLAPQPIPEAALLTGPLEPTNEAYALAKIAGVKMCQFYRQQYGCHYIAAMPTNLYGPGDNYHPENSHVVAALIRRFHEARCAQAPEVVVWGSGGALREFLYVDDLAEGLLFLLDHYDAPLPVNVGSSEEYTIAELAQQIATVVDYKGKIVYDRTKPDGTPRKKSDTGLLHSLGWRAKTSLQEGLKWAYADFLRCLKPEI